MFRVSIFFSDNLLLIFIKTKAMKKIKNDLIYIVDDDKTLNNMICMFLDSKGFKRVKGFYNGDDMIKELSDKESIIIIQDYDLPGMNGLDILKKVKPAYKNVDFIFLSGQSRIEVALDAIKLGAFDYIVKDKFAKENVLTKIGIILKIAKLAKERKILTFGLISFAVLFVTAFVILSIFFIGK
jgi:FixJ family two-component response regulator